MFIVFSFVDAISCYTFTYMGHIHPQYMFQVCIALVGKWRCISTRKDRRSIKNSYDSRMKSVGVHHPERAENSTGNNTCTVCRKKRQHFGQRHPSRSGRANPFKLTKTVYRCTDCKVFLCIRSGSSCWQDYHLKMEYWR